MNNLFRKSATNVGGYVPPTLVNLSLRGDKVRKFRVRRGTSLVPTSRNELILPYYQCANEYNEQVLLNTAIEKMKLFRDMKFRTKELDILHIAQFLFANKYHRESAKRRANKIARSLGYSNYWEYDKYLTDVEGVRELTKNERKFMSLMYSTLGTMRQEQADLIAKEVIKKILADDNILELYKYYVKKTAFAGQARLIDYEDAKSYIKSILEMRYPVGSKVPTMIIDQDCSRVYSILNSLFYGIHEAQSYITWTSFRGSMYYDRDENHWRHRKISNSSIRKRVNKLVRMLTNPFEAVRSSMRLTHMLTSEGTIKLDGEEYLAQLEEMDSIAEDFDGITLPEGISEELAKEIIDDSEQQYERHFVNYWSGDTSGNHGVAKIHKFTPTNTIHKAVREIAKRNSDRGVVPKHMHRMTTDKKVFANKTTVAGGSMMIDCSGSMAFYEEDIREIIDYLPASNIAGYVGYNTKIDGCDGMIKIIAKDGRIDTHAIRDLEEYGANSVDLDGLKWLAQQPEPRIWVSDQQVVGVNSESGYAVNLSNEKRDEIARFMRRHNIIPIRVVEQVKKLSKQLGTK